LPGLHGSQSSRAGQPRRSYRVTPKGVRAVKRAIEVVERMRAGLEPLLERA
jgi:hypothetical protein